jgi:hypothetical protein
VAGRPPKLAGEAGKKYLAALERGDLPHAAAKRAGVHMETVYRYRRSNPDFKTKEKWAMAAAREEIERVIYDLALQGDLSAAKMWLQAHDRATYGDRKTVEHDVSENIMQLSADETQRRMIDLRGQLEQRALDAGVIDVESSEQT